MRARSNYVANGSCNLSMLSEEQCQDIVYAAEEVLERTGVTVYDDEALETLKKSGCWVDGNRVRIPTSLVERCLRSCPERVTLCNSRTGSRDLFLQGSNAYFGSGSDTPYTIDPYTGERVRASVESVGNACKVLEALPNIDFVMSLGIVQDVPLLVSDRHQFETQVLNTSKPIVTTAHDIYGFADIIEMCEIIAGGEEELRRNPFMTLYAEPISPLQHAWEAASKLVLAAKKGLPVVYTPCVMAGGTVPATMAGVLVNGLAESLSGLVINQCTREGSPFIMGGVFTVMDMNTTIFSYGSPEFNVMMASLASLAHYLKIPMFGTAGCTDSCTVDEQAGIEAAISIQMSALSGANLIHDVGYIEYGSTSSLEMLVLSDELIGMSRRLTRGFRVDEYTLATEVIHAAGAGGHFLTQKHTFDNFKTESYQHRLFDHQHYEPWKERVDQPVQKTANQKAIDIIENYEVDPLSKDAQAKIREIVERSEKRADL